ncbi:MAG: hypothetical protein JSU94_09420 [Phycisphaerales bacterium]|nr:MAG: hypothetical protein JSU94_09420 [Phycisphaerales bacterium]
MPSLLFGGEENMISDCRKLKKSSLYVREWIKLQPPVKEESVTDWLLFNVSRNIKGITYRAFSRHEEARKTGADWEWWFLFPTFSAKMRIQAKKLIPNKDNYPSIAYTNIYGLQIEKLLRDSGDKNFMPFYAFYTSIRGDVMCGRGINDEGVYLSGGNYIYQEFIQNGKREVLPDDILRISVPLSCFLCCPWCYQGGEGFVRFLSSYFSLEIEYPPDRERPGAESEDLRGIYREVPSYVSSFIEIGREALPEGWEREFRHYLEGVNSMVVYDAMDIDLNRASEGAL